MKHSTRLSLSAVCALAAPGLTGCGGGGGSSTTPSDPQPRSISAALSNGLTATVAEDRATVKVGGVVAYTLTLTNNTAQAITFQTARRGAPSVGVGDELLIKNADSNLVYPLGAATQVQTLGPSQTLAPGQSVSATESVGIYNTSGTFSSAGRYSASVAFTEQTAGAQITDTVGALIVDAQ